MFLSSSASLSVVVQAGEDGDEEADMDVDAAAAESKQVYKPAKLAPVYYGQSVSELFFR